MYRSCALRPEWREVTNKTTLHSELNIHDTIVYCADWQLQCHLL